MTITSKGLSPDNLTPLEATHLRAGRYAVRPQGALGTCGWIDGVPWQVIYVTAHTPEEAVAKAVHS